MQPEPSDMRHEPETIEEIQAAQLGTYTKTLTPSPMFHTPDEWKEVVDWIEAHPPEDRIHLWTAAGMTWNLAASIVNTGVTEDA